MKKIVLLLLAMAFLNSGHAQSCTTPLRIVVLGSSTAWGNGVPSRDSAWTFRYARYLKANHHPADTVINLANGGFTTQHIQATGTPPYTVLGNTYQPDVNKNITRAIALAPHAIIINISNDDEGRGFPLSVQVANYLALKQQAAQANIPLWVATTQPRDNLGTAGSARLAQMRDSILYYFGDKAIDFWTGLASNSNTIDPAYASGDGFHFNSAGQRILFERVVAKQLPQVLCGTQPVSSFQLSAFSVSDVNGKLQLRWRTTAEMNTLRFTLKRSADSLNWSQLTQVAAAGNSTSVNDYTFTDNNVVPQQQYFYYLDMEGADGRHFYSNVVKGKITIAPATCTDPLRIVVLGSSTAWGNGVPSRDSAWTFRYARYLKANHNPADTVINLANGGFTTQHIQATGTPPYTVLGNTYQPDVNKNITRAIALAPHAIIVNISNDDEGKGFPLSVQVANYLALKQQAAQANIPLWVATTQPRDNLGTAGSARLAQMRDSILYYFGDKAIDFWTTLAGSSNTINPVYASGDGFHFNSAGQRILYERVVAAMLPERICQAPDTIAFRLSSFAASPAAGKLQLSWSTLRENNTVRFIIERSTDTANWITKGNVSATGNSTTTRYYSYTDTSVMPGQLYYYRLKMEASGSRYYYSNMVSAVAPDTVPHCNRPLRIVVLGSSTAWGDGLPNRDSGWVFRYARYLKRAHNAADTVINLAIGGYTTQHVLPDGTPPYTVLGNTFNVDTQHNITKALSLNPDAIIINMPTNDEARGFPLAKQTANFLLLKQLAAQANVPLWVSTTQPRGNLGYDAANRLRQMRDTIFQYFGSHAIDFYNGLATADGFIDPAYNSGDNVHFNAAGQRILFERVAAKAIPDSLCTIVAANVPKTATAFHMTTPFSTPAGNSSLYPNPATAYVIVPGTNGKVYTLEAYTLQGILVRRERITGNTRLDISGWQPGVYIIVIDNKQRFKLVKM